LLATHCGGPVGTEATEMQSPPKLVPPKLSKEEESVPFMRLHLRDVEHPVSETRYAPPDNPASASPHRELDSEDDVEDILHTTARWFGEERIWFRTTAGLVRITSDSIVDVVTMPPGELKKRLGIAVAALLSDALRKEDVSPESSICACMSMDNIPKAFILDVGHGRKCHVVPVVMLRACELGTPKAEDVVLHDIDKGDNAIAFQRRKKLRRSRPLKGDKEPQGEIDVETLPRRGGDTAHLAALPLVEDELPGRENCGERYRPLRSADVEFQTHAEHHAATDGVPTHQRKRYHSSPNLKNGGCVLPWLSPFFPTICPMIGNMIINVIVFHS
jgi:hypothetical protein